jgi:LmbE family N-acetylglucosaminyl deacetylase
MAGQRLIDDEPQQGAVRTDELIDAETAGSVAATRRLEDERFAYFAEASVVNLDLPDAVYRGYEGDAELLGMPRADDPAPVDILRREINRLEPQKVYFPLGVGNHVDHQLLREVGIALLEEGRRWVMPGPEYTGIITFYEDFPYAWWSDFGRLEDLPAGALDGLPGDVSLWPEYADISDQMERKITGITLYRSQVPNLFGDRRKMADNVRAYGVKIGALGGTSMAERYWSSVRV